MPRSSRTGIARRARRLGVGRHVEKIGRAVMRIRVITTLATSVFVALFAARPGWAQSGPQKEIRREPVLLWSGGCPYSHLFADDQSIYWVESRSTKPFFILWRIARSGGRPRRLSTECTALRTVDESSIYCSGYATELWRVPFDGGTAQKLEGCETPLSCSQKYVIGRDLIENGAPLLKIDRSRSGT
jgi:hypothetical protein